MSQQDYMAFRKIIDQSPALRKQIAELYAIGSAHNEPIDFNVIIEIGRRHDCSFTEEEANHVFTSSDELTDFELEMVAAGGNGLQGPIVESGN